MTPIALVLLMVGLVIAPYLLIAGGLALLTRQADRL